jgi:hypothetical protein
VEAVEAGEALKVIMEFFTLHDRRGTPPADGIISDLRTHRDNPRL